MQRSNLSRRRFHKLTMAAFGGLTAGVGSTALAQEREEEDRPKVNVDPALLLQEPHVCRGLNTCRGQGKGQHDCAGQGGCANVSDHSCRGENDCKAQGGCGGYPGQNTCNEKGVCAVPLKEETWKLARKQFEELMTGAGKEFGPAPTR